MATVEIALETETVADLLDRLGGIDPARVRLRPAPGTATEDDLVAANDRKRGLCELVDGVLVEKARGYAESMLAIFLGARLLDFVDDRDLGIVTGPDGMVRLMPGLVRGPDVAFVAWGRFPGGKRPSVAFPPVAPDLAVEVLSPSNTRHEMTRKRHEYFAAGTRLVWEVDPEDRTVAVYREPETPRVLDALAILDGEDVLPGFVLPPSRLFDRLDRQAP